MESKLNFKYPRARKLLLLFWAMAYLTQSSKSSLPADSVYEQYCESTSASQRVPQADFASELLKAMALLSITPRQVTVNGQHAFKGIAWEQVCHQQQQFTLSLLTQCHPVLNLCRCVCSVQLPCICFISTMGKVHMHMSIQ